MIKTDSGSIYELIHQESLVLGKPTFLCKQLKGNTPGFSKKYVEVNGFMLGAKASRKYKLELKLENIKEGVSIWMVDGSHTSKISIIKKF